MTDFEVHNADAAATVAKVLRLTRQDMLAWEATADPDVLMAPFKGEFVFRLARFFEEADPCGGVSYGLAVLKGCRAVVSFGSDEFSNQYFAELWNRAFYRANRIPGEFERVNQLLDSELDHAVASH